MEVEVAEGSFWAPLVFLALVFDHFAIESCSHNGIDGRARAMIWLNSKVCTLDVQTKAVSNTVKPSLVASHSEVGV